MHICKHSLVAVSLVCGVVSAVAPAAGAEPGGTSGVPEAAAGRAPSAVQAGPASCAVTGTHSAVAGLSTRRLVDGIRADETWSATGSSAAAIEAADDLLARRFGRNTKRNWLFTIRGVVGA